jgi:hypothetical protein
LLTTDSYMVAWIIYALATVCALLQFNLWLRSSLGAVPRFTLLLMLAAMALTPAHPEAGVTNWAPAIFVAGFDLLTLGPESAMRALRPILMMVALVLVVGLLLTLTRRITSRGSSWEENL